MSEGHVGPEPTLHKGRVLARPQEELTDQGLGFDVVTMLDRRQLLRVFSLSAVAVVGLNACGGESTSSDTSTSSTSTVGSGSSASGEIADETAGPFPGDGSNGPNVLAETGVIRSDIRSSFGAASETAEGVLMTLKLLIKDLANDGAPFAGAAVYVWHCDREGRYSLYSEGVTDQNYLRGVQIADTDGQVTFTSIFPACYSGRWPHIHFEIYAGQDSIIDESKVICTSQVALPEETCNEVYAENGYSASVANLSQVTLSDDGVFGDDDGVDQLATVTGTVSKGYTVSLTVGVDTTTTPTGGQMGMDGRPAGPPDGGPPGGP